VFAYKLARICWAERDGRIEVGALDTDVPGIDDGCPAGTYRSTQELTASKQRAAAKP
jgi:hypothetical protein